MADSMALPEKSRALLAELIRERDRINGLIEAVVQATRAALDVPEDYTLPSVEAGFVAPAVGDGPARGYGGAPAPEEGG